MNRIISDRLRTLVYIISTAMILFSLIYWTLELFGVIHSLSESLINLFGIFGILGFIMSIKTELGNIKRDIGRLEGKFDSFDSVIESKNAKLERKFSRELSKVKVSIGKLEGRLDEISLKLN